MKAHIHVHKPVALVWNYSPSLPEYALLAAACTKAGMQLKCLAPGDLSICVGQLCDLPGKYPKGPLVPPEQFPAALILEGLSDPVLDNLLADLRAANITIPLKAVVTGINRQWPLVQLLKELNEEHEAFKTAQK